MDSNTTMIVSGIVMTGMVLLIAPRVLAANKGVALRNIALWIGIFLLMALAYKTVGPGKDLPLAGDIMTAEEKIVEIRPTEADGFSTAR